jgi:hypothetical protein
VHHVNRDDLLAKEAEKEISNTLDNCHLVNGKWERLLKWEKDKQDVSKLSQKQRSQLRSYGN